MLRVTAAEPADVEAIADLVEEMDRFYGAAAVETLDVRVRQISAALFSDTPASSALLAWDGDRLVGLASYSFLWPATGTTRSLYLKELYVAQAARRRGIGRTLMRRVLDVAQEQGCSRVEWTTDDVNAGAQRFYESLGMKQHPSKLFYRLEGTNLARAASSLSAT